jgi:histidinol dehydrogenase
MEVISYPQKETWAALLKRPEVNTRHLAERVIEIIQTVRDRGDAALYDLTEHYDGVKLSSLAASETEIARAEIDAGLKEAIALSLKNITTFHRAQIKKTEKIETTPGVFCWRKSVPIERVGLYIPGGSAPLFSTVLMLAIPANIAGCSEIVLCTPPGANGSIHPAILYCAQMTGIKRLFKIGGAQAIAAMAYGTQSIPRVDKIFGPGNSYVTMAKQLVAIDGIAIDLPAGPSEVAVIGDASADPDLIAIDLLSQAEHGPDSQVIFVTDDGQMIAKVQNSTRKLLKELPRANLAEKTLRHSKLILLNNMDEIMDLINGYAPEHLILAVTNPDPLAEKVINAGSVFLGYQTPESAGDYASGTNHTLPTAGYARSYSGVSLDSFVKEITFQKLTPEGLTAIGPAVMRMAHAESLDAHRMAVALRMDKLTGERND